MLSSISGHGTEKFYRWLGFVITSDDVTVVHSGETQSSNVVATLNSISIICLKDAIWSDFLDISYRIATEVIIVYQQLLVRAQYHQR